MTDSPETSCATLVVLPFFPNERTGVGQRSLLLLEAARRCGPVHVVLVQPNRRADGDIPGATSITRLFKDEVTPRRGIERLHVGLARLLAPGHAYRVQPRLKSALLDLARQYGATTALFRYSHLYCASGVSADDALKVLVDVDDRDDQKYHSALAGVLGKRLGTGALNRSLLSRMARVLRARLSQASLVWFATEEDVWSLEGVPTAVLPNVPYWPAPDMSHARPSEQTTILFVGAYDHRPNRDGVDWFLDRVWPRIAANNATARVRIVGRGNWAAMADGKSTDPRVTFVGEVEDLAAEYAQARLAICPVREGGGSKIKVVEAAAFGRPIVSTTHGVRGFDGLSALDLLTVDAPEGFADACLAFLGDGARANRAGAALKAWQGQTWSREAFITRVASDIRADLQRTA